MTREEMERRAEEIIGSGCNCAETILQVAQEALGLPGQLWPTRIATCFGGGFGHCKQELCGALAGGGLALGLAYGRDRPGTSTELAQALAADFRERFIARYGSSLCGALLEHFGPQDTTSACKRLVAATAGILFDVLEDAPPCAPRP